MKPLHIRILLIVMIVLVFFLLSAKYNEMYPTEQPQAQEYSQQEVYNHDDTNSNDIYQNKQEKHTKVLQTQANQSFNKFSNYTPFEVNTKVFKDLKISPLNGAIISAKLSDYSISTADKEPINLLSDNTNDEYIAQSLVVLEGNPVYVIFKKQNLEKRGDITTLTLQGSVNGLDIIRTYKFDQDKYSIAINQQVTNTGARDVNVIFDNSLSRNIGEGSDGINLLNPKSFAFNGVAYSTEQDKFRKLSFKDLAKDQGQSNITKANTGWVSFIQHYFMSAWIPQKNQNGITIYSKDDNDNIAKAGLYYNNINIKPAQTIKIDSTLYTGPIIKKNLVDLAPNLDRTLDYGMLSSISKIIFTLLNFLHSIVSNWGLAIIGVTIIIKAIFYPLSAKSYKSMAKMRALQPRMKRLQEIYKDNKKELGQKTMAMYKEEKVNPLSGCLPMVIQIPVFIALYWVLLESVELRQASFLWIHDLSLREPYGLLNLFGLIKWNVTGIFAFLNIGILPLLMGISMFLQQKLSPAPADPTQAKVMMFLPVIFTFMFASFPAGLVLYWLTNNVISIAQQWYITHKYTTTHKTVA